MARATVPNPEGVGGKTGKTVPSNGATQQSPYAAALTANGMTRQTAHRYQALADVPSEVFEDALSVLDTWLIIQPRNSRRSRRGRLICETT